MQRGIMNLQQGVIKEVKCQISCLDALPELLRLYVERFFTNSSSESLTYFGCCLSESYHTSPLKERYSKSFLSDMVLGVEHHFSYSNLCFIQDIEVLMFIKQSL
ncbi:hypothetical protein NPIL_423841 [Nephila pilipes]|uniref:Uncharacterized protein n=1 Tax=Nephila pilipes TaxID=299642 RepID=A0A8X6TV24_NEPPI|nr:hypothetical protein NPIL_423841 [Nephila pilipes]